MNPTEDEVFNYTSKKDGYKFMDDELKEEKIEEKPKKTTSKVKKANSFKFH